jgi:hypothetical protein
MLSSAQSSADMNTLPGGVYKPLRPNRGGRVAIERRGFLRRS